MQSDFHRMKNFANPKSMFKVILSVRLSLSQANLIFWFPFPSIAIFSRRPAPPAPSRVVRNHQLRLQRPPRLRMSSPRRTHRRLVNQQATLQPLLLLPATMLCAPSIYTNTRSWMSGRCGTLKTIGPSPGRKCKTRSPASIPSRTSGAFTTTSSPHQRSSWVVTTRYSRRTFGGFAVYCNSAKITFTNWYLICSPMWEDAANKQGGRWVITLNKSSKTDLDNLWLDVVSAQRNEWWEDGLFIVNVHSWNAKI